MYHIRILDRDRQIQAILPDVQWSYTRRINQATEITIQIPRETVGEYITPEHVLFGFFSPTQPIAVGAAPVSTRPDKAQHAQIAAFVQVYQGTQLKASGCITGREIGQIITIKAMTEEILLESNITPAQYGRVWDGWDLADVARDLLDGWQTIRVKAQSQWQSYMVDSSHIDLTTEPGVVMLAKDGTGAYYESGYITLLFGNGEISDFVRWDRVRWSADSNDVVQTSIQVSYDGSNWSSEIDGGLPEEIGYYLGGTQSQVWVRINLHTTDTESEDPNGNPVGVTPYVFAVELIGRTQGHLVAGNIPASAGVTVKGLEADHANALQVLIDACEQNSWEFSVWNGALSVAESLGVNRVAEFVLRTGTNMEVTSLGDDDSELCNILTASGPGQGLNRLEITLRDDESIGAYGDYPQAIEFDVASLDELEQAAWNYLDTHNTPKTHFAIRAAFDIDHEPQYGLGDVVRVADPDTGIITTTRIMTESREYSTSGLSVRLDLGRARLNLQAVLDGRERLPKPVDPLTPVGVYARGVFKGLVVGCSEPKGSWSHTECHISTAKGFAPSSSTLVTTGRQTRFDIPNLAPGVRYYARLIHIDSTGRRSDPSREVSAVTLYIHVEDLDQAPPDTPVLDTCEFVRSIVLRWHPAARATEYEIRESDSDWGEAAGQVWRGNATTVTLTPTQRSHTYYIRAISAAGVYSIDAASITLTNATPSTPAPPVVTEFFSALWITIQPVADNDIVSYTLYMTPVDDEGDPTGDTQVTTYLSAGRITYNASPGTRFRVEVSAADVLGDGGKSTPVYAATNSLAEADIPEGIIDESKLTESLREAIEENDLGDIPHRLETVEDELDPEVDGSVKSQVLQLADEITLKVQRRQDGKLVIAGIGVAVDETGQSEVAMLADRFRILTSTDGEMKSVFAVDTVTGKVYILGDLIAEGLIRAHEVHAEIAKALLLEAQVATVDDLGALRIRADKITVGGEAPGLAMTKPPYAHLFPFNGSLMSTDGISPVGTPVATLRPDGRFGGCVAVEVGTTNLIPENMQKFEYGWGPNGGASVTVTQGVSVPEWGAVDATRIRTNGGVATLKYCIDLGVVPAGADRSLSVWVKNTGSEAVLVTCVSFGWEYVVVEPGETRLCRIEGLVGDGIEKQYMAFGSLDIADSLDFIAYRPQIEELPYATSFTTGTRAAGSLRVAQPLDKRRGTVSVWINPHYLTNYINLFSMTLSTGRFLLFMTEDGDAIWDFGAPNAGPRAPSGSVAAGRWDMHTLTWDADVGEYSYFLNGDLVGTRTYVEPDSLPDVLPIYNNHCVKLDELLVAPFAATPEQIAAWYAMGAPFVDPQDKTPINADQRQISAVGGKYLITSDGATQYDGSGVKRVHMGHLAGLEWKGQQLPQGTYGFWAPDGRIAVSNSQVYQVDDETGTSTTSAYFVDVPGMELNLTVSESVLCLLQCSFTGGVVSTGYNYVAADFRLTSNGSEIPATTRFIHVGPFGGESGRYAWVPVAMNTILTLTPGTYSIKLQFAFSPTSVFQEGEAWVFHRTLSALVLRC